MKKVLLFLIGFAPLLAGIQLNEWMLVHPQTIPHYTLIGIVTLFVWLDLGFATADFGTTPLVSTMIINFPGFLFLLLTLVQDIIYGHYWQNLLGEYSKYFFLTLTNLFTALGCLTRYPSSVASMAFVALFAVYWAGAGLRNRNH